MIVRLSPIFVTLALVGGSIAPRAGRAQPECPRGTLPAYAHNDYENPRPLHEALERGFRGVEVDVFLVDGTLRIGHDRRRARNGPTFEALYLAPLHMLITRCRTLTTDGRPFLLAVELKEQSPAAYDELVHLLSRYHSLFTHPTEESVGQPAVEVVLVGWHPVDVPSMRGVDSLIRLQYRLTHPGRLALHDPEGRVRLVTVDYGKTLGRWSRTRAEREQWIATLHAVKAALPGSLLRVHNVPPRSTVYAMLLEAGVDLIGTKRLERTQCLLSRMGAAMTPRGVSIPSTPPRVIRVDQQVLDTVNEMSRS